MTQLTVKLGVSLERFELRHSGVTQWATRQQKIGGKLVTDGGWLLPPSAPPPVPSAIQKFELAPRPDGLVPLQAIAW